MNLPSLSFICPHLKSFLSENYVLTKKQKAMKQQ